MAKRIIKATFALMTVIVMGMAMAGCGGGGGGAATPTGAAKISLTDAPATDLDHVWITVKEIRFHKSETAEGPEDVTHAEDWKSAGWLRYPLPSPVTIDLNSLSNGAYQTLWDGITLPAGLYQQIRIILAGTEEPLTESAIQAGLHFNNQVDKGIDFFPLRIPAAQNGIKLVGNFQVTTVGTLHLVVDFDVSHDVVATGNGEYILKPRLKYFDMSSAGSIQGRLLPPAGLTFADFTGFDFVIKAERPNKDKTFRVVTRATSIKADGSFVLSPLPADGVYDLVIRGRNTETMIVRNVPVTAAVTTVIPDITLKGGSDYPVSGTIEPKGGSVTFYQTLPAKLTPTLLSGWDQIPYEIRMRNANPLDGAFNIHLSAEPLMVGDYSALGPIVFTETDPVEGPGAFTAIADALLYEPSAPKLVTPLSNLLTFTLEPIFPDDTEDEDDVCDGLGLRPHGPGGTVKIPDAVGIVFIVYGGTVINTFYVDGGFPLHHLNIALPAGADKEFHGSGKGSLSDEVIIFKKGKK